MICMHKSVPCQELMNMSHLSVILIGDNWTSKTNNLDHLKITIGVEGASGGHH